ncbi:SMC-Scp complex subunit ScpB [Bacteriovoracaceae bacterium]|nr:SMC-Scp complex subunit ScpB [Bacteriovoracaceae bacterium]
METPESINEILENDIQWMEKVGLNETTLSGVVEALIFMSDRPIGITKIKDLISPDASIRDIHNVVVKIQEEYEKEHRGIRLIEVAEGFQFRSRPVYSEYVKKLVKVSTLQLTPTALEVLAIVAYRQPIARSEIDKIRGVDSSHILRALMDKKLVKVVKRSQELGRPTQYGTTQEFLEVFNLNRLEDLPPEYEIASLGTEDALGLISDIKVLMKNNGGVGFGEAEINELAELDREIKSINYDTLFTKELRKEEKSDSENIFSPFDVLEEHVTKTKIANANLLSVGAPEIEQIVSSFFGIELGKREDPEDISDEILGNVGFNDEEAEWEEEIEFVEKLDSKDEESTKNIDKDFLEESELNSLRDQFLADDMEEELIEEQKPASCEPDL